MFRRFFTWLSSPACGCAYPGTDWVTVATNGDGTVLVQEIGHLCDLWSHSSDPNNVRTDQPGGTHDQITHHQCCRIRTARFTHVLPPCTFARLRGARLQAALESWVEKPFERRDRGSCIHPWRSDRPCRQQ